MTLAPEPASLRRAALRHELDALRGNWIWFLLLGLALVVLGTIALGVPLLVGLTTVVLIGWMLLIGGVLQAVGAFWSRDWSGFLVVLLSGLLYAIVGFLFVWRPGVTLLVLTMLLAAFLMVGGLFHIIGAVAYRFSNWGWVLLHGIISLVLGVMIWQELPGSAIWVIGLFVGLEMIINGWTWVMLALSVRRLPKPSGPTAGVPAGTDLPA